MDNKRLLQQVAKIDKKADLVHIHDDYISKDELPKGGFVSIDIASTSWVLGEDGLYTVTIEHKLGTDDLLVEATSSTGKLLLVGFDCSEDLMTAEITSEEAIDMNITIIHRAEQSTNSVVGYNPINDETTNNFQTWSSQKITKTIEEITGATDLSHLATKQEVTSALQGVAQDLEGKANKAGSAQQDFAANNMTVSGSILPATNKTLNIGSPEARFKGLYVDEAYLSTNTLYIGDTPIMGTTGDTIMIKADEDQSITMRTTATGTTKVISQSGVEVSTSGTNANVNIQATGVNSQVNLSSTGNMTLAAPMTTIQNTTNVQDLNVSGNLVVSGDKATLQTRTLEIKDNLIDINKGEVGSGVTAGYAGLKVDRGESDAFLMVFDESDDKFKTGTSIGTLKPVAYEEQITSTLAELKSYTDTKVAAIVNSAPEALDTLQELSKALGDDPNFATTVSSQIGTKADKETTEAALATKAEKDYVDGELTKKAEAVHEHDDRYYSKSEVDNKLSGCLYYEIVSAAYTLNQTEDKTKAKSRKK